MTTKQNIREAAKKLSDGQMDPNSTVACEILQEIAERVLREVAPEDETTPKVRSVAA